MTDSIEALGFIDMHCHSDSGDASLCVRSLDVSELAGCGLPPMGMPGCGRFFSIGIYPWFIERQAVDVALAVLAECCQDERVLAVGECGLDKCISTVFDVQLAVFARQVALSERIGKPLVIHCVRAFNELQQLRKTLSPTQVWIVHGFSGHRVLAEQLVKQGFYLSFGKALLQGGDKIAETLRATPPDRWFLETDEAAGLQIGAVYQAAAKIAGLDSRALQERIYDNFKRVFRYD
ncbi:MAG: TatD family hydrolase [Methylomonas sp.]|nr:TatD family hydrolase [Methylomonas sp.]PPD19724.1 MAG: deoxyribonuclease [Methylomonas sp.]PPD25033.1 MAG: deoxyribonuclease [Methylomonas sp.]PPD39811.1 MAG: deoxyribonuclease [Methylomonas sp.]PPD51369.1 MAG: deoxyribonuclease [Methylomonas sp.]